MWGTAEAKPTVLAGTIIWVQGQERGNKCAPGIFRKQNALSGSFVFQSEASSLHRIRRALKGLINARLPRRGKRRGQALSSGEGERGQAQHLPAAALRVRAWDQSSCPHPSHRQDRGAERGPGPRAQAGPRELFCLAQGHAAP